MTIDLQPLVLAVAGLVIALTPILVARLASRVDQVARSVDGTATALQAANGVLLARVEALHAAALEAAKQAPVPAGPAKGEGA